MNHEDKHTTRLGLLKDAIGAKDARERAHKTYERAATQFGKLLGTILGGLGVVLAAWLQRIFEKPEEALLHQLMWYLAAALVCVAAGLVLLASTALLDQWSAKTFAATINANEARYFSRIRVRQIRKAFPPGEERSQKEFDEYARGEHLDDDVKRSEARANLIDLCSRVGGVAALICLVAAFATLACGVLSTARTGTGNSVEGSDTSNGTGTVTHNPKP